MLKISNFILLFLLLTSPTFAVEKVIFASPEDLPPKIFKENGVLRGTYVDIITAICKRLNVEPVFVQYPWVRAMVMVKNGKVDAIFPPFKTKEREEFLYFPTQPMSRTRNAIFARKIRKIKINKLEDLKNYTVGTIDQYSYGAEFDRLKSSLTIDLSRTEEMQINKLAHHGHIRMDVAAASEEVFKFLSHKMGKSQDFETLYIFSENSSYVAFSKAGDEKNKKFAIEFDKTLKQLQKEGVFQKINDRYFK